MRARIIYNGYEYESVEAMPDDVRRAYEEALTYLADANRNGIPDVMERDAPGGIVAIHQSSIRIDGPAFERTGETPAFTFTRGRPHVRARTEASLDRVSRTLEVFLGALLGVVAVVVLVGAVLMMKSMDASSRSQGGRIYVAVAALVLLSALEAQAARLVRRRWGSSGLLGPPGLSRRFAVYGMLFLLLAAALLFGLALRLP